MGARAAPEVRRTVKQCLRQARNRSLSGGRESIFGLAAAKLEGSGAAEFAEPRRQGRPNGGRPRPALAPLLRSRWSKQQAVQMKRFQINGLAIRSGPGAGPVRQFLPTTAAALAGQD